MLSLKSELRPDFSDLFSENRFFSEYLSFTLYGHFHRFLPNVRCRGRAVMLIPGFLAGDLSLGPLAGRLRELGCQVFFSGLWCNVDCPVHTMLHLEKVLRKASHKTSGKVSLIGHSLGGIYARELAWKFPELVECAILLGSPVKDPLESSNTFLRPLFELAHRRCADEFAKSTGMRNLDLTPGPLNVPETIICSKTDGIVQWQNCIESGRNIEVIEVPSSHLGLPYSSEVFAIIAARLARGSEQQLLRPVSSDVGRMSLRTNRPRHELQRLDRITPLHHCASFGPREAGSETQDDRQCSRNSESFAS
jgi:triacylglycerol lipase